MVMDVSAAIEMCKIRDEILDCLYRLRSEIDVEILRYKYTREEIDFRYAEILSAIKEACEKMGLSWPPELPEPSELPVVDLPDLPELPNVDLSEISSLLAGLTDRLTAIFEVV